MNTQTEQLKRFESRELAEEEAKKYIGETFKNRFQGPRDITTAKINEFGTVNKPYWCVQFGDYGEYITE